jgi:hypothetical protein
MGVTGHRDIRAEDTPALEAAVESLIQIFRTRLPSTPIVVLSGLAQGADQLVARVALRCGASLAAVLPMPADIYRTTMDASGRDGFDELLPQASLVIQLPLGPGVGEEKLRQSEEARAEQYEALAVFVATCSQAVIALWDGNVSDAKGGTYRVIEYALGNPPGAADSWAEPQSGIVYQVVTPRERDQEPLRNRFSLVTWTSLDRFKQDDEADRLALETMLDTFNRDAMRLIPPETGPWGGLLPGLCKSSPESFACRLEMVHGAADTLSMRFSEQTKSTLMWILGFALTAIGGFEIYAHVLRSHFGLWLIYPAALVGAWFVHRLTKERRIEKRYLDYRALAEALRVQFFWDLAGIRESVADYYLVHHRTELDWIRYALRAIRLFQLAETGPLRGDENDMRLVQEHWIEDQRSFYDKTASKQKEALERLEFTSIGSLRAVWILSLLIPVSLLIPSDRLGAWRSFASEEPWLGILILLTSLPSIAIGLFRVWIEQGGYAEQVRTYHRMADVFRRADNRLDAELRSQDPESRVARLKSAQEVILHLGIQALEENGDWLLLHRDRPIKIVN